MSRHNRRAGVASFLFSLCLVAASAFLLRRGFHDSPPADFNDLYLLCVLALAYRHPWRLAAAFTAVTLAVSAYLLAPLDSGDALQLISYGVCASLVIWIMASLRSTSPNRA